MEKHLPSSSDHELVQLYKQSNNLQARDTLMTKYYKDVHATCIRAGVRDTDQALDVTHSILISIFEKIKKGKCGDATKNFKAWFLTVAKNEVVDYHRKNKKCPTHKAQDFDKTQNYRLKTKENPETLFLKKEALEQLQDVLQQIDPIKRIVLEKYYFEDMAHKDIGVLVNALENTTRNLAFRGKKEIRKIIEGNLELRDNLQ